MINTQFSSILDAWQLIEWLYVIIIPLGGLISFHLVSYSLLINLTKEGNVMSRGAGFWSTLSTGKLAFLNDMMSIFKLEVDKEGNLSAKEWEWK